MISFDNFTGDDEIAHNLNWLWIPDHPYGVITMEGSGSGKTDTLINLIKFEDNDYDYDIIAKIHFTLIGVGCLGFCFQLGWWGWVKFPLSKTCHNYARILKFGT